MTKVFSLLDIRILVLMLYDEFNFTLTQLVLSVKCYYLIPKTNVHGR